MAHSNSTQYYNLPQFDSTDKPAWLVDVNPAYSAIDTGIHAAKTAADSAQSDATQALSDASSAGTTASGADAKATGSIASLADTFDSTATYNIGDLVIYNNLLYICIVAVTVPGAWTGSENWSRTTLETEINKKQDTINRLTSASTLDGTEELAVYDGTGTKKTTTGDMAGLANAVTAGTLTFESNFNDVASYIKKVGNVVYIHLDCSAITPISARSHILTIPDDLYPNEVQRFICIGSQIHQGVLDSSCFGFLVTNNGALFVGDGLNNAITDIFADLCYVIS